MTCRTVACAARGQGPASALRVAAGRSFFFWRFWFGCCVIRHLFSGILVDFYGFYVGRFTMHNIDSMGDD